MTERPTSSVDAPDKFWGSPTGPNHPAQNPHGGGDSVQAVINILPFDSERINTPPPPRLSFVDSTLHAGEVPYGDYDQFQVQIGNEGFYWLELTPDLNGSEDFSIVAPDDWRVEPLDTTGFDLLFHPQQAGWREAVLTLQTDDPQRPTVDIILRGFATGESAVAEDAELPTSFAIIEVYPNPFNESTSITVTLPRSGELTLELVDVLGRSVGTLHNGPMQVGEHTLSLSSTTLASGIYLVRAHFPDGSRDVRRIVHLK
ncbi:T9SS type A sorting domain-containing protein [bacterium]|nr:T9SS type A sorting domain-containing protein [bacterium]